jgi:hypothetical protein
MGYWQEQLKVNKYGTHADRPLAGAVSDKTIYNETDTKTTFQAQSGAWVQITSFDLSGSTFPTYPLTGQMFLHTPTGRKILYQYDGSAWQPIKNHGSMTIYVDTTGTDDLNHGTATGTDAFLTIQYAINAIPPVLGGNVGMYIGAGTFTENINFNGKLTGNNYSISVYGALSSVATLIATGNGTQGATSTLASFVQSGITTNAYQNKILKFTSGANDGTFRIIDSNDTTTITLAGQSLPAQPATNDTATVYDWGTIVTTTYSTSGYGQLNIYFYGINFNGNFYNHMASWAYFGYCKHSSFHSLDQAKSSLVDCYVVNDGVGITTLAQALITGGKYSGSYNAIFAANNSIMALLGGVVVDTAVYGIMGNMGSVIDTTPANVYNFIRNCSQIGVYCYQNAKAVGVANNQYSGNTGNTFADAATFSFIAN